MLERAYRARLQSDLARWQADGVIAPAAADAIRATLKSLPEGAGVATIVGIVGGLLIAAAFVAFIAANWSEIARPLRFVILLAGIVVAHGVGAVLARDGRTLLADTAASVGAIIFGATIALVGQMYHLGNDFAGGLLLWAIGAMAAALLTGSRGALAVALAVGCGWSGGRLLEQTEALYLPFVPLWLVGAGLAVAWDSAAARHLVGVAAIAWLISSGVVMSGYGQAVDPNALVAAGAALYLGAGLMLASVGPPPLRSFGATLSDYGAFVFVAIVALALTGLADGGARAMPAAIVGAAAAGVVLACIAAALARHVAPLGAAVAIALGFTVVAGWTGPLGEGDNAADNWLAYALSLIAMLALVTSGTLDDRRPRIVAGWLGLAAVIADITWALHGSLIRRALFLAIAGVVAIALATALGRVAPKEESR